MDDDPKREAVVVDALPYIDSEYEEPGMKDVCMRDGWSESIERLAQIKHEGDVQ